MDERSGAAASPDDKGRSERRARLFWLVGIVTFGALGFVAFVIGAKYSVRERPADRLWTNVTVYSGGSRYAANGRGTDVAATVQNLNEVPVDVTLLVIAYGMRREEIGQQRIGPIRNLAPGSSRPITDNLGVSPVEKVRFEVINVEPAQP